MDGRLPRLPQDTFLSLGALQIAVELHASDPLQFEAGGPAPPVQFRDMANKGFPQAEQPTAHTLVAPAHGLRLRPLQSPASLPAAPSSSAPGAYGSAC